MASSSYTRPANNFVQQVSTNVTEATATVLVADTWTDIGLSVTITPRATTSKILISLNVTCTTSSGTVFWRLVRGSTAIAVGDAAGSRIQCSGTVSSRAHAGLHYVDSPSTTSATTYKIQAISTTTPTVTLNNTTYVSATSSIIAIEIGS